MGRPQDNLSLAERCCLVGMLAQGLPKTEIARRLGRHRSTIHRELERLFCSIMLRNHLSDNDGMNP